VGVYFPEDSNLLYLIKDDIDTTLVEADPNCIQKINKYFAGYRKVKTVEAAVFDFHGEVELCRLESSTFISQLEASPALINDGCKIDETDKFVAKSILFSEIDNGNYDLISIDIEGAEWFVLKHMVSRPNIISLETHGKYYSNPNIAKIRDWIRENNYFVWYKDNSDTVYVKKGIFQVTIAEHLQLLLKNIAIWLKRHKRIIK
jgi:FkbM family methyltransferase